jgi:DNA helicase-2/ATP-dependent DNA helicase PcrA
LSTFYSLIGELIAHSKEHGLKDFINFLCEKLDLRTVFTESGEEDRALYLDEFLASINDYVKNNRDATISSYLSDISLAGDSGKEDNKNQITLGTIHAVKGLEFRVVFVVGLEYDIFPISRARFEQNQLNEERRLMYVALTRARERLYCTRARSRFLYGKRQEQAPSPFFNEVKNASSGINKDEAPFTLGEPFDRDTGVWSDEDSKNSKVQTASAWGRASGLGTQRRYEEKKPPRLSVGAKVIHKSFGKGVVMSTKGDNAEVVFESAGIKVLDLKYAPLEEE